MHIIRVCLLTIYYSFQFVQVTIIIVFFRMRATGYLYEIAIGNVILPLQFIVRGYQIYHFQKKFKMLGKWAKSAFYFFMYIIAGHVSLSLISIVITGSKEKKSFTKCWFIKENCKVFSQEAKTIIIAVFGYFTTQKRRRPHQALRH